MHAWLCTTLDGVDSLTWQELPTPEPTPGTVRIAIRAASTRSSRPCPLHPALSSLARWRPSAKACGT